MYDLFNPPPPYQRHSTTSRTAAEKAATSANTLRAKVYEAICTAGSWGATDDELQSALMMNPSTQRPRRIELVKQGLVEDSGKTRATRSGRKATVWIACR